MRWMSDPFVSRKLRGNVSPLRCGVLGWELDGQTTTTLLAPTTQYLATPFRLHSRAESMRTDPALVSGTISWLTHLTLHQARCTRHSAFTKDIGKERQIYPAVEDRSSLSVM